MVFSYGVGGWTVCRGCGFSSTYVRRQQCDDGVSFGFLWCSSTVASNNRKFDWVVLSLGRYSSAVVSMANMENIDWVALEGLFCTGLVQQVLLITLL
jgi:hypothetical protein